VVFSKQILLSYFADNLRVDTRQIEDDTALFSSGMVDSFAIVELVMWLEQFTGQPMGPEDIDLDHLDTVARIMRYVAEKRGGA